MTDIVIIIIFIAAAFFGIIGWAVVAGGARNREQFSVLDVLDSYKYSAVTEAEAILQKGDH